MSDSKPVVLVFGATGGIGQALCRRLVQENCQVFAIARNKEKLAALVKDIGVTALVADVRDSAQVQSVFDEVTERVGSVDGVAHCVGALLLKPGHLTLDQEWADTIEINLTSAFYVLRGAVKAMRKDGGSVALVSSAAARLGLANHEAIAAAKAGIQGLTLSAAATYAPQGIRVNCVAPGLTETPMTESLRRNEASRKASENMHPLGRLGKPEEVASALAWLLDREQSWVTGQIIGVDGGLGSIRSRK